MIILIGLAFIAVIIACAFAGGGPKGGSGLLCLVGLLLPFVLLLLFAGQTSASGDVATTPGGAWLPFPAPHQIAAAAPEGITDWLEGLMYFVGVVVGLGGCYKLFWPTQATEPKPLPQPFTVQAAVQFVDHKDLDRRLGGYVTIETLNDVERRLEQHAEENFRNLDSKRSGDVKDIHGHLSATVKEVAGIKAVADMHTQTLSSMDQKITMILQRLPKERHA